MKTTDILELLDAPTTAPAWPKNGYGNVEKRQELDIEKAKTKADTFADEGPRRKSEISYLEHYSVKVKCHSR